MSTTDSGTYEYITRNEVHLKALDMDSIFMNKDEPIPWDLVTSVEPGGSCRLGISTSQWVKAKHPSGIEMRWSVDLEPRSANGTGTLQLDIELIAKLLDKAPRSESKKLMEWVQDAIDKINEQIKQQTEYMNRLRDARNLFESAIQNDAMLATRTPNTPTGGKDEG